MFGLNVFVEPDPTGRIDATKQVNYNIPFRKRDAKLMIKQDITGNYFRQEKDIPPQYPYHSKIHHEHVTINMNNLQNFNACSKGLTYFEEHETNKHIHNATSIGMHSHPSNKTKPNHRDNTVTDKIDKWRKSNNVFEKHPEHSMTLKIVKV
jgi:hypothetical protein